MWHAHRARVFTGGDARPTMNKSGFDHRIEAAFFSHKNACQLEGGDHGGRDRRPSWHWRVLLMFKRRIALATAGFGPAPSDVKNYTPRRNSVNEIFKPRNYRSSLTLISAIPILPCPQSRDGQVAQLVERGPEKAGVGGSIPSLATILNNSPA